MKIVAGHPSQLVKGLANVFQVRATDKFDLALRGNSNDEAGNTVDDLAKSLLGLADGILAGHTVLNIGICHVPFDDSSRLIWQWIAAEEVPAKFAVDTAKAAFDLECLPGAKCFQ